MSVANVQPLYPRKGLVARAVLPSASRGFARPAVPGNRRVLARRRVSCHVPARLNPTTPTWQRRNGAAQKALESLVAATAAEQQLPAIERRLPAPRRRRSAVIASSLALTLIGSVAFKDSGPAAPLTLLEAPLPETAAASNGDEGIAGSSTPAVERDAAEASAEFNQMEEEESTTAAAMPDEVRRAIDKATRAVGVDAEYMRVVAARESSFDPEAHAHRTTASGLYQFTAGTWLRAVKMFGAKHGLADYADLITIEDDGLVSMTRGAARTDLLSLRSDPELAALMAAELARDNALRLERMLGRSVTPAETYMAHLFGVVSAARMIGAARSAQHVVGAELLPAAARSNPHIFNAADGPASAREIVAKIGADFRRRAAHNDTSI
jgi:Transglycosylase SLT domain